MKVVVTVSTGNSGGGAVHDYLIENTKFKNPFKDDEFRLIDDPDGILNLYYNFYKNRSINNPSNSIMRFKNYVSDLIKLKKKKVNIYNSKILSDTDKYIKSITTYNYYALPQFIALQSNYLQKKYYNIKKKFLNIKDNSDFFKMYMPVDEEIFFKETKKYLFKLIKNQLENNNSKHIILDQAVNIWNYAEIFSYFDDVKIILVTRDPRGIYNSMKTRQSRAYPGHHNVKSWSLWYEILFKKYINYKKTINKKYSRHILEIKFEDFVLNYEKEQEKILNFLNIKKYKNNFQIKRTKTNAFRANNELSNFEKNYIKKKLKKYLHW